MKIRKRLPDGSFGELEEIFPVQIDPVILMLTEAIAGLQEQVMLQQVEIDQMKGGGE